MALETDGVADWRLAAICFAMLIGIFGVLAVLVTKMSGVVEKKPEPQTGGQRRRGALDRMQRSAARTTAALGEDELGDDNDEDDEGGEATGQGRAVRRNLQKQQKKQEKKEHQQAEKQVRQQQDANKSEKQQKYNQKLQEKEAERLRKEEEEKKAREEKDKQEQAEFDKWKNMFAIEAEGEDDTTGSDESAVERFIEYVKIRKVVNLEDIAAEFRMKTSAAIDRLEQLEKLGRLSGIFDDRGKFVYITAEEMAGVADWLRKRGRINRADLVAACNRIIRLNPTEEDKAKLQQEAQSAAVALGTDMAEALTDGIHGSAE